MKSMEFEQLPENWQVYIRALERSYNFTMEHLRVLRVHADRRLTEAQTPQQIKVAKEMVAEAERLFAEREVPDVDKLMKP